MKTFLPIAGCACLGALLLGGCSNGAQWGEEAGAGGGRMGSVQGMATGESLATGGVSANLAGATAEVIGQGKTAEQERIDATRQAESWLQKHRGPAPHFLAVGVYWAETRAGTKTLLYNTRTRQIGAQAYVLNNPPPSGTMLHFRDHPQALYIGAK